MYTYLSSNWLQDNDATHPSYLSGPMDTKKSRYSSSVDHRSLDDLCTSTYTMSQKLCTLSVLQKECRKFGVRIILRCALQAGKYGNSYTVAVTYSVIVIQNTVP
jgi:hypothetical protein